MLAESLAVMGIVYRPHEDERLLRVVHPLATATVLCVNCESYTGDKAVRQTTPEGRCATCGSASVVRLREPEWKWLKKEEGKN